MAVPVSIIMPVYNCEKFVAKAIKSILNQSFKEYEFIIIDDGSTDNTETIIKSFHDTRIIYIKNSKNLKIVECLNKGLSLSRGKYILRMDADDISVRTRIEEQVRFMESNTDIGILGTYDMAMNTLIPRIRPKPVTYEKIRFHLLFENPLVHPSVIMRNSFIRDHDLKYNYEFNYSEDYELWSRCADLFKIVNLNKALLKYRLSNPASGTEKAAKTILLNKMIVSRQLQKLNLFPDRDELDIHLSIWPPRGVDAKNFLNLVEAWYLKLSEANKKAGYLNHELFISYLSERWMNICLANINSGYWVLNKLKESLFYRYSDVSAFEKIRKIIIYQIKRSYFKNSNQFGMR